MIKMSELVTQTGSYGDLDKEVTFEVTENVKVTRQVKYRKEDAISLLIVEINKLKEQIQKIEQKKAFVQEESLIKMWDNEYDEKWNDC